MKRGRESDLDGFKSPIPIAADESVLRSDRRCRRLVGPLRRRQHQARQVRRLDRGARDGARSAAPGARASWSATWSAPAWRWRRRSCSASCATSWIWTVRYSWPRTAQPSMTYTDGTSGAASKCGAGRDCSGRMSADPADLVRSAARPDHPVLDRDVGDLLLLRHARAAGLLHDQAAADRPGKSLAHLRHLYGDAPISRRFSAASSPIDGSASGAP